jgi:multidrug resistance efflux pump
LLKSGNTAVATAEQTQSAFDQAVANLGVAKANLVLVERGSTEPELAAARADVQRLRDDLRFKEDQLERTRLRAPGAGRVITPNVDLLLGKYLTAGTLFAELEDSRTAYADISIPEGDIGLIGAGNTVRLRPWGAEYAELPGKVVVISPKADTTDRGGSVIRVKTEVPNLDGVLRPQMTGYAKIDGREMYAWEAFSRMVLRFILIEVWSWIP